MRFVSAFSTWHQANGLQDFANPYTSNVCADRGHLASVAHLAARHRNHTVNQNDCTSAPSICSTYVNYYEDLALVE